MAELVDRYDVVVVGSGYGGAVAAARLAQQGVNVAVLERGKEYHPGDFPSQLGPFWEQTQIRTPVNERPIGPPDGLFHLQIGNGISALVGCALGGTSQINAGVVARPIDYIFCNQSSWPEKFRSCRNTYFERVEKMLDAKPIPKDVKLPKVQALKKIADLLGAGVTFSNPKIAVTFESGPNFAEVHQNACLHCGECVAGCNYGAKNTLTMNYLPCAKAHGAELFTGVTVDHLESGANFQEDREWTLSCHSTAGPVKTSIKIRARIVILAAGTLGTTKILLKTQRIELEAKKKKALLPFFTFSDHLGHGFSGNGDMISFGVSADEVCSVGTGDQNLANDNKTGPCIAGMLSVPGKDRQEFVVQEGVAPLALARILGEVVCTGAMLKTSLNLDKRDHLAYNQNWVQNTQIYLVSGHDDGKGTMQLNGDLLFLNWPDAHKNEMFDRADELLGNARYALDGQYVPNPFRWKLDDQPNDANGQPMPGNAFTVHPLGGCRMAESASDGVVNFSGQVFRGKTSISVFKNLYVMDGSVIPHSLGINPLLTIAGLAEYLVEQLISNHLELRRPHVKHAEKVKPSYPKRGTVAPSKVMQDDSGLMFSETLLGYFKAEPALLNRAKAEGDIKTSTFRQVRVDFTFEMSDVGNFLEDAKHEAQLVEAKLREIPQNASETDVGRSKLLLDMLSSDDSGNPYRNRVELLEPRPPSRLKRWVHRWFWGRSTGPYNPQIMQLKKRRWFTEKVAKRIYKWLITESREMKYYFWARDAQISRWRYRIEGIKVVRKDGILSDAGYLARRFKFWWWWHWKPAALPAPGKGPQWWYRVRAWASETLPDDTQDLVRKRWAREFRYRDLWDDLTHIEYKVIFDDESPYKGRVAGIGEARVDVKISDLLMRLTKESNGIDGLGSLLSTYALIGRTLIRTHLDDFHEAKYGFEGQPPEKPKIAQANITGCEIPTTVLDIPIDGSWLRLTRFKGGSKGPVLLIHGFGTASTSFAVDSMKGKNLVQYLVDLKYDVWLVDYRVSIIFEESTKIQCTLDEIARKDIPLAVQKILDIVNDKQLDPLAKVTQLDIIAQCQGAVCFWMALLDGKIPPTSIRRVISSQCGPILVPWFANKIKAPLADFLGKQFGVKFVRPYPIDENRKSLTDHVVDRLLSAYPLPESEQCNNATCQRITGIYGLLYRHRNIQHHGAKDDDTHATTHYNLHNLFGPANMTMFRHIASNFANGKILDNEGRNVYLPGINNQDFKKIPVLFIHGRDNFCFDKATAIRNTELLTSHGWNARYKIIDGFGHLDCIIGDYADQHVFPHVERFLE